MDTVKIGIIGLGNMGSTHAKNISAGKIPGMELSAVADTSGERREWAKGTLPDGVRVFDDAGDMIKSGLVQAVLIATPHYDHPPLSIEALKAGLHVMCEKPAGVYVKQVREMNAVAEKSGRVFALMFNQRTNCTYRKMHELVHSGRLGAIKRVSWIVTDWYRTQAYYDAGGWRATWDGEGGGVLINQCPHNLDMLQWICGMPSRVRAFCHNRKWHDIEVEDDVTAYLEFPNGATGTFVTSTADAPGTNRFEILMEGGRLLIERGEKLTLDELKINEREFCRTEKGGFEKPPCKTRDVETDGSNEQHNGVLKAFVGNILHGTPLVAHGKEGVHSLALSNAMHLSSWLEKTVELPMDEELFLSELNSRRAGSGRKAGTGAVFEV